MKLLPFIGAFTFWIGASVMGSPPLPSWKPPSLPERCVNGPAYERLGDAILKGRRVSDPSFDPGSNMQMRGYDSYPQDPGLTVAEKDALRIELKSFWHVFHHGANSEAGKKWTPQMRDNCAAGFDVGFRFPFPDGATDQVREQIRRAYNYGFSAILLDPRDEAFKDYHAFGRRMRGATPGDYHTSQVHLACLEEGMGKKTSWIAQENPQKVEGFYRGWMYGFAIRGCNEKLRQEVSPTSQLQVLRRRSHKLTEHMRFQWQEAAKSKPDTPQRPDDYQRSEWLTTCIERARQVRLAAGCSPNYPPRDLPSKVMQFEKQVAVSLSGAKQAVAGAVADTSKAITENVQAVISNPKAMTMPKMGLGSLKGAPAWARVRGL